MFYMLIFVCHLGTTDRLKIKCMQVFLTMPYEFYFFNMPFQIKNTEKQFNI